jgi:uncharacterized protein YihD (DUF1040 family)
MVPQWPRVVSATMLQFPSKLAASAGTGKEVSEVADSTMLPMRLPNMKGLSSCLHVPAFAKAAQDLKRQPA